MPGSPASPAASPAGPGSRVSQDQGRAEIGTWAPAHLGQWDSLTLCTHTSTQGRDMLMFS